MSNAAHGSLVHLPFVFTAWKEGLSAERGINPFLNLRNSDGRRPRLCRIGGNEHTDGRQRRGPAGANTLRSSGAKLQAKKIQIDIGQRVRVQRVRSFMFS